IVHFKRSFFIKDDLLLILLLSLVFIHLFVLDWLEESNVPFHEHVFLEDHLNKEHLKCKPLASFLELVCNGLSQNPHITVTEKRQHLDWFSKFFDDKISRINASVRHEEYMTDLEKVSKTNSP
ncbi:unnamed protein product, partial [Trichobilharzia regenti]